VPRAVESYGERQSSFSEASKATRPATGPLGVAPVS
jgi:hypothetical protein